MNYKILLAISAILAIVSIFLVSQATTGVWAIGVAILFSAYARIAQADLYQNGQKSGKMTVKDADRILREHGK